MYSPRQRELLRMWQNGRLKRINLLEGSVRSGKTWISMVVWALWVASQPKNRIFLMCAKTLSNLQRNVLEPLVSLVGERYFSYSISKKSALLFDRRVYLEGANDSRAESKIRGLTLGGAYCDELSLFSEDFFAMLLSRLSEPGAKLFATTNPDNPNHWLMQKYIKRRRELDMLDMKFMIDDNVFLDKKYVESLKREYTGVFYDRFILGKWVAAEGAVYSQFASDPERWLLSFDDEAAEKEYFSDCDFISLGIDFGGNRSLTTFVATAVHKGFSRLTVLADWHISGAKGDIDSGRVNEEFVGFVQRLISRYPDIPVKYCFADSEAQYLINGLRGAARRFFPGMKLGDCSKVRILQRIYCTNSLLNTDRLKIMPDCTLLTDGLRCAVWDDSAARDKRLDNFSSDIDILDAFEYSFERFIPKLN